MGFSLKQFFGRIVQGAKDHKNDLMMSVGTAGVVSGTVVLCKETLKTPDILEEYREARAELEAEEAEKKEITKLRLKTAGKMTLNFLPGAMMEAAGLGSMWGGYSNVKTALIGVGAAYNSLQDFVDHYREGVREKYGEDVDAELAYGVRMEEVVKTNEDGTQTTEKVRIYPNSRTGMPSMYARYFTYGEAEAAERSLTYNKHFLEIMEETINRTFRARKKMMLNEVYEYLGIKQSVAGNHVGWVYDKNAPEGDNYIDLRVQEVNRERADGDGWERVLMIDPNVDGMVEARMLRLGLMDE